MGLFLPKQVAFFDLMVEVSDSLIDMVELLDEFSKDFKDFEKYSIRAKEIESQADQKTHEIIDRLNKTFITPIDREDIYSLSTAIDNIAGNIHGAASRMKLYHVDKITKSIRKLTEINLEACQNIDVAVKELRNFKKIKNITDACARINKLENKSDTVYDKAVADIFENETDAKTIIKYKEVLSVLETAADKCKSAANVLESIAVKHS